MSQATLLVVDDEPTILAALSKTLGGADYRVRAANNGERAIAIASSEPKPDLILLDVMMPGLDGYEVLSRLKGDERTADIPVMFVTAMEGDVDEEKGLELGAVDYIMKPIRPAILLARVHAQLTLKKARDFLKDKTVYLEAEVARRMADNQTIQDVSILSLAHLAETRDPETGEHIRRTQGYVQLLAEELRNLPHYSDVLTDYYIELLTKSAPLHDIGKVGIPDHVLLKPGRLNDAEWEVMKTHAALGAQAIEQAEREVRHEVDFLRLAKEIAHWHHERWDGTGYPDGLAGDAIPLSARIMALADVFDAVISSRVYKSSISHTRARDIIVDERGKHFDPDVTDAFLRAFDAFREIADRYNSHEDGFDHTGRSPLA